VKQGKLQQQQTGFGCGSLLRAHASEPPIESNIGFILFPCQVKIFAFFMNATKRRLLREPASPAEVCVQCTLDALNIAQSSVCSEMPGAIRINP
jgi:hypothetical protein